MTNDQLVEALCKRRAQPDHRVDMHTIDVPALYPPLAAPYVLAAMRRSKLELPLLLQRIYSEVGNGGFGPGGGLLGLDDGYPDSDGRNALVRYEWLKGEGWPTNLLALWDWGGGSWSCIDVSTGEGDIVTMDEFGQTLTRFTLASWLEAWILGIDLHSEIYELEMTNILNPFTRKPTAVARRSRPKGRIDVN